MQERRNVIRHQKQFLVCLQCAAAAMKDQSIVSGYGSVNKSSGKNSELSALHPGNIPNNASHKHVTASNSTSHMNRQFRRKTDRLLECAQILSSFILRRSFCSRLSILITFLTLIEEHVVYMLVVSMATE